MKWENPKSQKGKKAVVVKKKGRPKKVKPEPEKAEAPYVPEETPPVLKLDVQAYRDEPKKGGCVECGAPLAEGQTYVCKDHIRRN